MKRATTKKVAVVTQPVSYSKYDLIKYFTLMRDSYTVEDAKAWSELYCKRNGVVLKDSVRDITAPSIFMYLLNNGIDIPDTAQVLVNTTVTNKHSTSNNSKPRQATKITTNYTLEDAYLCIDQRLDGAQSLPLNITSSHVSSVIAYANKHKKQIKLDYDHGGQTHSKTQKMDRILDLIIAECELKRKPVVKKASTVKTKATQARNVKFATVRLNGSSSLTPDSVIGKRTLWVYDTEKKLLLNYISTTGFTFSGTTLHGYVGTPIVYTVTDSAKLSIRVNELVEYAKTLKTRKLTISGRFNDNYFILTHT